MQIDYTILGDRIGITPELRHALNAPISRTPSAKLGSKIPKFNVNNETVKIKPLKNGQLADARENLQTYLLKNRIEDRLDEEKNYHALANMLAGYYSFDTDELAKNRKKIRDEYNMENTKQLIKQTLLNNPNARLDDIEYQENYPVPKTTITYSPEEERFLHQTLTELTDRGVVIPNTIKTGLVKETPALFRALTSGYPNERSMSIAFGRFRRLGRDIFTEEKEEEIRKKTRENEHAQEIEARKKLNAGMKAGIENARETTERQKEKHAEQLRRRNFLMSEFGIAPPTTPPTQKSKQKTPKKRDHSLLGRLDATTTTTPPTSATAGAGARNALSPIEEEDDVARRLDPAFRGVAGETRGRQTISLPSTAEMQQRRLEEDRAKASNKLRKR